MRIFVILEWKEGSEVETGAEGCQYQLFKDDEVESTRFNWSDSYLCGGVSVESVRPGQIQTIRYRDTREKNLNPTNNRGDETLPTCGRREVVCTSM